MALTISIFCLIITQSTHDLQSMHNVTLMPYARFKLQLPVLNYLCFGLHTLLFTPNALQFVVQERAHIAMPIKTAFRCLCDYHKSGLSSFKSANEPFDGCDTAVLFEVFASWRITVKTVALLVTELFSKGNSDSSIRENHWKSLNASCLCNCFQTSSASDILPKGT